MEMKGGAAEAEEVVRMRASGRSREGRTDGAHADKSITCHVWGMPYARAVF